MNNSLSRLTNVEAIFTMVIITINRIILNQPQRIINSMGSSAILNVIYVSFLVIAFTIFIIILFNKFDNSDIIDVSAFVGGKILKFIVGILMIVYLILISSTALRIFVEMLHLTYYNYLDTIFIILFFIILCITVNYFGEHSIIKTNVIVSMIILLSFLITFLSATDDFIFQKIYPLLGYGGYNTFLVGISNISAFNGLFGLYFIKPLLLDPKSYKKVSIISIIIISLLLIISTVCLLLSLSDFVNINAISPIYRLIEKTDFGSFIHHPESLFVFTWILSVISYLNIVIIFIIHFMSKTAVLSNRKMFKLPIYIMIFIVSILPRNLNETYLLEKFIYTYILFPLDFVIFPIILILGNIKLKKKAVQ